MEDVSSFTIVLSIIGFMAFVTILVSLFYKPGKRLILTGNFKKEDGEVNESIVELVIENIGKKKVKMNAPYIRIFKGVQFKIYQLKTVKSSQKFPRIIEVGEQISFDVNVEKYFRFLRRKSFSPTHLRIFVKDTMGLKFRTDKLILRSR